MDAPRPQQHGFLPHGFADLARQLAIWFGFLLLYQVARGFADRDTAAAFENGLKIIDLERRAGMLFELSAQSLISSSEFLLTLTAATYWLSQFAVLGLALLWVYLRRNESFLRFRNTIMLANVLGLVGYTAMPTAPPRMFPDFGFVDTLSQSFVSHSSSLVQLASNPFAAMPSLHVADALIVGVTLATIARRRVVKLLWLTWPAWVAFTVLATANHYWLDIAAALLVAGLAAALVYRREVAAMLTRARV